MHPAVKSCRNTLCISQQFSFQSNAVLERWKKVNKARVFAIPMSILSENSMPMLICWYTIFRIRTNKCSKFREGTWFRFVISRYIEISATQNQDLKSTCSTGTLKNQGEHRPLFLLYFYRMPNRFVRFPSKFNPNTYNERHMKWFPRNGSSFGSFPCFSSLRHLNTQTFHFRYFSSASNHHSISMCEKSYLEFRANLISISNEFESNILRIH